MFFFFYNVMCGLNAIFFILGTGKTCLERKERMRDIKKHSSALSKDDARLEACVQQRRSSVDSDGTTRWKGSPLQSEDKSK